MKQTPEQPARMAQHFEQVNRERYGREEPFLGSFAAFALLAIGALAVIAVAAIL